MIATTNLTPFPKSTHKTWRYYISIVDSKLPIPVP